MVLKKIFSWFAAIVICSLLLTAGCSSKLVVMPSSTGAGSVITPGEGSFRYNRGSVQKIVAMSDPNYHFVNWGGTAVDAGKVADANTANTTVEMDADYTLQANFAIDKHTLMVSSSTGGSVGSPGEGSFRYDHGSVQRIVATAVPNYHFVSWTGTAVDAGKVVDPSAANTTVKMDADYTLHAGYAKTSAVVLALKFTPQDSTTYKLTTQAQRSIKWEGPLPAEAAFKGGQTSSRIEITFTRQIQSTDDKGNAVAKITIEGLKYLSIIRDNPVLDFDSSGAKDRNSPLAKLIGQSYTIEITPASQVSKIIDVSQAQAVVKGSSSANKTALALLSPNAIKERHTIPAMPAVDKNQSRTGDNWSSIKTFFFGLMGSKSYERIYTLKEVKEADGRRVAIVEMKAVPTTEMAELLHKELAIGDFSKMFDNTETYTGQLKLDLTAGKVEKCLERLQSEWIAVEPSAVGKDDEEPAVLKMTAIRLYRLEKID